MPSIANGSAIMAAARVSGCHDLSACGRLMQPDFCTCTRVASANGAGLCSPEKAVYNRERAGSTSRADLDAGMEILLLQRDDAPVSWDGAVSHDGRGEAAVPVGATNLAAAFVAVARARAAHVALATPAGDFTYGWLLQAAEGVRRHLRAQPGFAPGARVALQIANSPEYLAAFYGTLLADGVVVPLPVALEARRRQTILDLS